MQNCPRDNETLIFVDNKSGTFSYCKKCWGIFIAGKDLWDSIDIDGEYLKIILKKWIKINKAPNLQPTCSCNTKMITIKIQETFIDICPSCKWTRFDYQELGKIKRSIKNERPSVIKAIKEIGTIDAIEAEKRTIKFNIIRGFISNLLR